MAKKNDKNFNPHDEFNKNIGKLLHVLSRILKNQKFDSDELKRAFKDIAQDDNINLNVFFTFMPIAAEEFDELSAEFEEMFDEGHAAAYANEENPLKFELTVHDHEFLKKNGISF